MAYADLLTDVADTLDRDDVTTRFPRWLKLVEVKLNRVLDDPAMEVSATLTGNGAALPADFGAMVSIGTADGNRLSSLSPSEYSAIRPSSGTSRYFTIQAGKVFYVPGAANPTLIYRRTIPPLTSVATTNWLLDRAPDVYFYGVLLQAEAWDANNEQAVGWKALFDEAIDELRSDGAKRKWGAGPIGPRIRRA